MRDAGSGYTDGYGIAVNEIDLRLAVLVSPSMQETFTSYFPALGNQAFLDTMATEATEKKGKRVLLVLDNASWRKTKRLKWHHIEPVYLPPYSPDFTPIERLWHHLKSHHLAGLITKDGEALGEKIYQAIRSSPQTSETIRSVCRTPL